MIYNVDEDNIIEDYKINFDLLKQENDMINSIENNLLINDYLIIIIDTHNSFSNWNIKFNKDNNIINKVCMIFINNINTIELLIGPIYLTKKKVKIISSYIVFYCKNNYTDINIFENWIKENNINNYVLFN